ncbi:CBS domain-containing protein [Aliarcobacter butzleri]|uniref:CBS domain-containing protein n=1 Tax=Aliarcobacter butzleri TaxID=28197 RepID=UPI00263E3A69|nr:CBS domain-containing protein [Aliarcobacter butzleri]MDN5093923.1 CBS domain-containing protein [Aliarcobacter butzleri]
MFTIYNNGTVGFRSTSDNLYNLQTVEEAEPVRFEPKDGLVQDFSNELNKQHKQDFLESYKKIANLDTLEPVYQIKDIMTKDVIYMDNKSTVEDVYNTIRSKKVYQIPITAFGKKIIGIVNKKVILNLLMNDIENAQEILKRKIEDIYLPEILTAEPESDVRKVVQIMLDLKLDAIPIVDENDVLMGIVSKTDILKAVSHLPKLQLWS